MRNISALVVGAWLCVAALVLAVPTSAHAAQSTTRVSLTDADGQGDDYSLCPSLSTNGYWVAFTSFASNLVTPAYSEWEHVFVRDLSEGDTYRVSVAETGGAEDGNSFICTDESPAPGCEGRRISDDGRFVVFTSYAKLVAADTLSDADIYVRDRARGVTSRISGATSGEPDGESFYGTISQDGRYVAFQSTATNLVAGDANGVEDVFVKDTYSGTVTLVSSKDDGTQGDQASRYAAISGDASKVVFVSNATNLVDGDTNGVADVFVWDRVYGGITRVSVHSNGTQADGASSHPSISDDGRWVVFLSDATTISDDDTNGQMDVFLHDTQTSQTTRIAPVGALSGAQADLVSASISGDGRFIGFYSTASTIVGSDTNGVGDVFVFDRTNATYTRVSVASGGGQATGESYRPSMSGGGGVVAFCSAAADLVAGDTNTAKDVFLYSNPAYISGTITDASMDPLQQILVWVGGNACDPRSRVSGGITSAAGQYFIEVRNAATSYVSAFGTDSVGGNHYAQRYYDSNDECIWANGVSLTPGQTTEDVDFVMVQGNKVTGTVTDTGATGLYGIVVGAASSQCNDGKALTYTNSSGEYELYPDSGTWYVHAQGVTKYSPGLPSWGQDYVGLWYHSSDNTPNCNDAEGVNASSNPTGIDFALEEGGRVTGHLSDDGGWNVGWTYVNAGSSKCGYSGYTARSDATGAYDLLLPAGDWYLHAQEDGGPYVDEWWDDQQDCNNADAVTVTAGASTTGKDFVLAASGAVGGYVTDSSGAPVEGIYVQAGQSPCQPTQFAQTDATGLWQMSLAKVPWYFSANGTSGGHNFVSESYNNQLDCQQADPVTVEAETPTSVDFQLQEAGSISGTVYEDDGTTPIEGLTVNVYSQAATDSFQAGWATTAADGTYQVDGIPAGDWYVQAFNNQNMNYPNYWWTDAFGTSDASQAQAVTVVAEATNSGKDFHLPDGATVSGSTWEDAGLILASLPGVWIDAYTGDPCNGTWVAYAQSDGNGDWTMVGLDAQDHWFIARPTNSGMDFADEWWQDTYDCNAAQAVSLSAGQTVNDIIFNLDASGTISGTISDSGGSPLANVKVSANSQCAQDGPIDYTDDQGYYELQVPDGTWYVFADGSTGPGGTWGSMWWDGQSDCYQATGVAVTAGETYPDHDFTLREAGAIAGRVTDSLAAGIEGVWVSVPTSPGVGASTDAQGYYTVYNVSTVDPPASHKVYACPSCAGINGYANEYYDNRRRLSDADYIEVNSGQTTSGIDFTLEDGGAISGTVTDGTNPIEGLRVVARTSACEFSSYVGEATTAADGTYTIAGVPAGSLYVLTDAEYDSLPYTDEWWDDRTACDQADAVTVNPDQTTSNIDFALAGKPDLVVTQDGSNLDDDTGTQHFGAVAVGANASLDFVVENQGSAVLNLDGDPRVEILGANASDFIVTTQPGASLAAGGTSGFTVQFAPTGHGMRQATLYIHSNDPEYGAADYTYGLSGWATVDPAQASYDAPTFSETVVASLQIDTFFGKMISLLTKTAVQGPGPRDVIVTVTTPSDETLTLDTVRYTQGRGTEYVGTTDVWLQDPPEDGTYTFTATDSAGRTATATVDFTYADVTVPTPTAPDDGAYTGTSTPTLSVDPVAGGLYYLFTVRAYENGAVRLYNSGPLTTNSVTVPEGTLQNNSPYSWTCVIMDATTGGINMALFTPWAELYTGTKLAPPIIGQCGVLNACNLEKLFWPQIFAFMPGLAPWDIQEWTLTKPDSSTVSVVDGLNTTTRLFGMSMYSSGNDEPNEDLVPDGSFSTEVTDWDDQTGVATMEHVHQDLPTPSDAARVPADNAYLDADQLTFTWDPVAGDHSYRMRIYAYGTSVFVWQSATSTETTAAVPEGVLLPGSSYEWVVQVVGYTGSESATAQGAVDGAQDMTYYFSNLTNASRFTVNYRPLATTPSIAGPTKLLLGGDGDRDGDGIPDSVEEQSCTDPDNPDSDGDGIADGVEDANKNGSWDQGETNPCSDDSDGDLLKDGEEDANHNGVVDEGETDPNKEDTDGDGMPDGYEVEYGLNPLVDDAAGDKDGDGYSNKMEYERGTDPSDPDSKPTAAVAPIHMPLLLKP